MTTAISVDGRKIKELHSDSFIQKAEAMNELKNKILFSLVVHIYDMTSLLHILYNSGFQPPDHGL